MKVKLLVLAAMVSMFSLGICQSVLSQDKAAQTWSAKSQTADYRIGAADVLEIATWKETGVDPQSNPGPRGWQNFLPAPG